MRNAIWFKDWLSNKVQQLDDVSVAELIQKVTDGKTCCYCKALYGECLDEEDAIPSCNSRLIDWCSQSREIDLSYCGVTGVYRYDEKEKMYIGVTIDGTGGRIIPFYGKTPDDLFKAFMNRVSDYNLHIKEMDKEMKKLDELQTIRVLKDGEATGIIARNDNGKCYMLLIFRGYIESVECKDISMAFDFFLDFAKEKQMEVKNPDFIDVSDN